MQDYNIDLAPLQMVQDYIRTRLFVQDYIGESTINFGLPSSSVLGVVHNIII